MATLFSLVLSYDQQFARLKTEQKLLDFSDLEHMALRLLMEKTDGLYQPTALARQTAQEFEEVLVDEYQDTNSAQDMLFFCRFPTGKKSFYGGRCETKHLPVPAGDARIFMEKLDSYHPFDGKNYPAKIMLGKNFRSRQEVTGFVNFVFRQLMSRKMGKWITGRNRN